MIINNSYFQGDIKIPNSQDSLTPLTDRRGNFVDVEEYIAKFERQIMIYALGLTEYKDFIDQFETNGDLKAGATQKWKDFTDGKEYTVDSVDKEWLGLRYTQGTQKYSLIAYYIFSKFASDFSTKLGDAGVQKSNSKASRGYSSIPTVVEAHNEFLKIYQGDIDEGNSVKVWYGKNISGIDYFNQNQLNDITSMYEYLQDNADVYTGVTTRLFAKENSFGL
jgi:hypothetical protein